MKWTYELFINTILAACVAAAILVPGCGLSRPALTQRDLNPNLAAGKWQHVPAAVQAAVGPNEFAVLSDDFSDAADVATFQLQGVHGLQGEIVVRNKVENIEVATSVKTNLRKSEIERMLTRDVKLRLEQLLEKGWAPLPPSWE